MERGSGKEETFLDVLTLLGRNLEVRRQFPRNALPPASVHDPLATPARWLGAAPTWPASVLRGSMVPSVCILRPVGGRAHESALSLPGARVLSLSRGWGAGRRQGGGERGRAAWHVPRTGAGAMATLLRTEHSRSSRPGREADSPSGLSRSWRPGWDGYRTGVLSEHEVTGGREGTLGGGCPSMHLVGHTLSASMGPHSASLGSLLTRPQILSVADGREPPVSSSHAITLLMVSTISAVKLSAPLACNLCARRQGLWLVSIRA